MTKCNNCGGTGRLGHFSHHDNGVCYACAGTGKVKKGSARELRPIDEIFTRIERMRDMVNDGYYTDAQVDANSDWARAQLTKGVNLETILTKLGNSMKQKYGAAR